MPSAYRGLRSRQTTLIVGCCASQAAKGGTVVSGLSLIQYLAELLGRDTGILHRVGRLPMPELFLHSGDVAGLGDDMLPHGVAGTMRRSALHMGHLTHGIPDGIDGSR